MSTYGLIGYPLENSFSETYFNNKFKQLGLHHQYINFPIATMEQFPEIINANPDLAGLNVTIPHKISILSFLSALDETAKQIGAVNCISFNKDGTLMGHNTDAYGFEKSLVPLLKANTQYSALVLGTGGSSLAVCYVLQQLGIDFTQVSRSQQPNSIHYQNLTPEIIANHQVIINCTPVGMFPNTHLAPINDYSAISANHIAYDLIYFDTAFLANCKKQGATTQNGLPMLHLQAEKSWEIWK